MADLKVKQKLSIVYYTKPHRALFDASEPLNLMLLFLSTVKEIRNLNPQDIRSCEL